MTRQDVLQMMAILKVAYPGYYKGMTRQEAENVVNLWTEMFAEDDPKVVAAAVKALIATDEKGYPPHIGAVKGYIRRIQQADEMTELEAWSIVSKALGYASNEPYSREYRDGVLDERTMAERTFQRLPEVIQKAIGSHEILAAWARLPPDEVETVIASNFMRAYKAKVKAEKDYAALPSDVKKLVDTFNAKAKLLEESWEERNETKASGESARLPIS